MTRNDILWKGLIENLFPHFIPFFLPPYQHLFNFSRPATFLDKELQNLFPQPERLADVRFVDKLVKVYTTAGEEKWVLIHIEVQGYYDKAFPDRMFSYYRRILDHYGVPITALAIFTDERPSFCPNRYEYSFAGTTAVYEFNTYKVLQQNEQLLAESDNPFAIAILTVLLALKRKKLEDSDLLGLKVDLVKQLLHHGFESQTIRYLFNFIRHYVNFAKPETAAKFELAIESFTPNRSNMGIEEIIIKMARQEGKVEGKAEGRVESDLEKSTFFVENLLRSTNFDEKKIASLAGVEVAFVKDIKTKLGSQNTFSL
jgi:predicted transposase YdaD